MPGPTQYAGDRGAERVVDATARSSMASSPAQALSRVPADRKRRQRPIGTGGTQAGGSGGWFSRQRRHRWIWRVPARRRQLAGRAGAVGQSAATVARVGVVADGPVRRYRGRRRSVTAAIGGAGGLAVRAWRKWGAGWRRGASAPGRARGTAATGAPLVAAAGSLARSARAVMAQPPSPTSGEASGRDRVVVRRWRQRFRQHRHGRALAAPPRRHHRAAVGTSGGSRPHLPRIGTLNVCPNSPRSKRWPTICGGTPSV